jgi:uncharacterized protein with NAD-binding domain and iron-sulfur cluster
MSKVVVIGGGIAGLSVAHHLLRGRVDEIHVYEPSDRVGGKAKNQSVAGEREGGVYPAEHGFRFFPHFYRHIVDTMRTTPTPHGSAFDLLVASEKAGVAHDGQMIEIERSENLLHAPSFVRGIVQMLTTRGIGLADSLRYGGVLLQFATSCQERRDRQYDDIPWSDFAHWKSYDTEFVELVIKASRNLSAMRAPNTSATTIGSISLQMIFDFDPMPDRKMDPVLPGPTEEVWLQPWFEHLRKNGVTFHFGKACDRIDFDARAGRVRSVAFGGEVVVADEYVLAVPLEVAATLVPEDMRAFDVSLRNIRTLAPHARGDMVGLQFYLREDVPIVKGHVHYPKTPFALTSVSQAQFWTPKPSERPSTPELGGILSVIISDWDTAGTQNLRARDYTDRRELLDEVWRQLATQLPAGTIDRQDVLKSHLDDNVLLGPFANATPLLIHPVGQLKLRPDAETAIDNFSLASDYVRTFTDLATMEGADEAARRAVVAILRRHGVAADRLPFVRRFTEGPVFDGAKLVDRAFFAMGLPHPMQTTEDVAEKARGVLEGGLLARIGAAIPHLPGLRTLGGLPAVDHASPDADLLDRYERFFKQR